MRCRRLRDSPGAGSQSEFVEILSSLELKTISLGCEHCYAETFAERFRGVADHPYGKDSIRALSPRS